MQSMNIGFTRLLFVITAMVCPWPAQAGYEYTSIDDGVVFTEVFGINNSGHVVGVGDTAFVYDSKKGVFTPVPDVPGFLATAVFGINEPGVMVGIVLSAGFNDIGLIRDKHGTNTFFSQPGWDNTNARGVSNTGLVTGYSFDNAFTTTVGFIYDPAHNTFIDFLPSPFTLAQGINARGDVVGNVTLPAGAACTGCPKGRYGFLRSASGAITYFRVNNLPSVARGITDSGLITGAIRDPITFNDTGFVVSLAGSGSSYQSITVLDADLLRFPGAVSTTPEGMTNAGDVVGIWIDASDTLHGFIATPSKAKK